MALQLLWVHPPQAVQQAAVHSRALGGLHYSHPAVTLCVFRDSEHPAGLQSVGFALKEYLLIIT